MVGATLLGLVPGALLVYAGFQAGGFFAGATAAMAVVLALVLVVQVTTSADPLGGAGPPLLVALAALGALLILTFASSAWSGAPARALLEADRVLLYTLALAVFGLPRRSVRRLRWIVRGLAIGIVVVCGAALISRVLPEVWPIAYNISQERLSFPITYWNALGLLAAIGVVLCFAITADLRERAVARVLAAGALPLLVATLYFTFSRAAIVLAVVGLVVLVALGRSSATFSALAAMLPAAVAVVAVSVGADALASTNPTSAEAVSEGHGVALATGLCVVGAAVIRALGLRLDRWLEGVTVPARTRRLALAGGVAVAVAAVVAATVALDLPGWLDEQRERLVGVEQFTGDDQRDRLTDLSNNGRVEIWDVALQAFAAAPAIGNGAGTYQLSWAERRPSDEQVVDGHSLYLELLAELGVAGLALVLVALAVILATVLRRCRGRDRMLHAGLAAALLAWVLAAGLDWHWEMPVVTLWVFAVGGAVLAGDRPRRTPGPSRGVLRIVAGLAVLLVAVAPALIFLSQARLAAGVRAFERGDCQTAIDDAAGSLRLLPVRPEPYELLAYCDARLGLPALAERAIARAIDRDPDNWEYRYDQAVVRGAAGNDPRPALRAARRLNPREPRVRSALRRVRDTPGSWRRWARSAPLLIQ